MMAFSKEDEAGTIYQNTSQSGKEYLKITINGQKFIAYRNGYKKEAKHPDWNVYIDKPREQSEGGVPTRPGVTRTQSSDIGW